LKLSKCIFTPAKELQTVQQTPTIISFMETFF
jgi:hypothetical protein